MSAVYEEFVRIMEEAVLANASDVFVASGEKMFWRIQGEITSVAGVCLSEADMKELLECIADGKERQRFAACRKVDLLWQASGRRYRIHWYLRAGLPGMVIRSIPSHIPELSSLGQASMVKHFLQCRDGLLVVAGPTGAGKSTTVAALLNAINQEQARHILTLEDPVEFILPKGKSLVSQLELGRDVLTYSDGVTNAMRESPDVIFVSEVRDGDTAQAVLSAALSGHFVVATMHTGSAAETVERFVSMYPHGQQDMARSMLSSSIRGICCQRLLPGSDGSRHCAVEMLMGSRAAGNIIRSGRYEQLLSVIQAGANEGMQSMAMSIEQLRNQGLVI